MSVCCHLLIIQLCGSFNLFLVISASAWVFFCRLCSWFAPFDVSTTVSDWDVFIWISVHVCFGSFISLLILLSLPHHFASPCSRFTSLKTSRHLLLHFTPFFACFYLCLFRRVHIFTDTTPLIMTIICQFWGVFYIFFVIILCLNCLSYIFVVISASSVSFNISLESFCLLCAVIYYCLFHFQLFYVSEILLKPHLSDLTSLCGFFMSASGSFMFFSSCLSSVFLWFDVFFCNFKSHWDHFFLLCHFISYFSCFMPVLVFLPSGFYVSLQYF